MNERHEKDEKINNLPQEITRIFECVNLKSDGGNKIKIEPPKK